LAALTHLHDEHAKQLYSIGYVVQCTGCFAKSKDGGAAMTRFDPCEVHAGGQSQYCCMQQVDQLDLNDSFKTLGIHKMISGNQSYQIASMTLKSNK
jgi:hypothetical protein